jgi:hypothetical protein
MRKPLILAALALLLAISPARAEPETPPAPDMRAAVLTGAVIGAVMVTAVAATVFGTTVGMTVGAISAANVALVAVADSTLDAREALSRYWYGTPAPEPERRPDS